MAERRAPIRLQAIVCVERTRHHGGYVMTDRPKRLTPEMALAAAKATAADLLRDGQIEVDQIEVSVVNLAKHGRLHMDGYELAKALDNHCGWDIDAQMVETLDGFSWHAREE